MFEGGIVIQKISHLRYDDGKPLGLDYNVALKLLSLRGGGLEEFYKVRLLESEMLMTMKAK